jgi:hypothetical protein
VTAASGLRLFPQAFEPVPGNAGVMGRVLGISVAEVILHRPQISALIGQVVAAGVAEHVRPDAPERCGLASDPHDAGSGLDQASADGSPEDACQ